MKKTLKRLFCRHEYDICRDITSPYYSLRGEQLYRVCRKCGKVKKYIYVEFEGNGYK